MLPTRKSGSGRSRRRAISRAAKLLAGDYDLVITNVPYLAKPASKARALRMPSLLKDFHPDAKADLATVFVSRISALARQWQVLQAVVVPQNWLFLTSLQETARDDCCGERTWRVRGAVGAP